MKKNGLSIILLIVSTFFLIVVIYTTVEFLIADANFVADENANPIDTMFTGFLYAVMFALYSFLGLCSSVPAMLVSKSKATLIPSFIEFAIFFIYLIFSVIAIFQW